MKAAMQCFRFDKLIAISLGINLIYDGWYSDEISRNSWSSLLSYSRMILGGMWTMHQPLYNVFGGVALYYAIQKFLDYLY